MNKVRLLMYQEALIQKIEISLLIQNMERLTNNGTSFMLMNGRENQAKENTVKDSVSMLKEISMWSQSCQIADILI